MDSTTFNQRRTYKMQVVHSEESWELIKKALDDGESENLVNASFMLTPIQIKIIRQLAQENRYVSSQGAILRYIIDEWMRYQLESL
jgi:hypothetical protein